MRFGGLIARTFAFSRVNIPVKLLKMRFMPGAKNPVTAVVVKFMVVPVIHVWDTRPVVGFEARLIHVPPGIFELIRFAVPVKAADK
jgi:hypothetical protein